MRRTSSARKRPLSTHVDARGEARMVDVGAKEVTVRRAVARARVAMKKETAARLRAGDVAKGTCSPSRASPGFKRRSGRRS